MILTSSVASLGPQISWLLGLCYRQKHQARGSSELTLDSLIQLKQYRNTFYFTAMTSSWRQWTLTKILHTILCFTFPIHMSHFHPVYITYLSHFSNVILTDRILIPRKHRRKFCLKLGSSIYLPCHLHTLLCIGLHYQNSLNPEFVFYFLLFASESLLFFHSLYYPQQIKVFLSYMMNMKYWAT